MNNVVTQIRLITGWREHTADHQTYAAQRVGICASITIVEQCHCEMGQESKQPYPCGILSNQ